MVSSVEIISASAIEESVLANLLELYAHDFSEFHDIEIGEDGKFHYQGLARYWSEPDWHPFLIKTDGKLAGLALVKKEAGTWDMAEFFVLRGMRRLGLGTRAAHAVWKRFPGPWEIRVMQANLTARNFWARVLKILSVLRFTLFRLREVDAAGLFFRLSRVSFEL